MVIENYGPSKSCEKRIKFLFNSRTIADILISHEYYSQMSTVETVLFDDGTEFRLKHGIVSVDSNMVIQYNCTDKKKLDLIVADIMGKRLLYCNEIAIEKLQHNTIVSCEPEGCTWEGDVWEGSPCGWGYYYDAEYHLLYEGFRVNSTNVCYGTIYYPEGTIKYQGMLCDGKMSGVGTFFTKEDEHLSGEWFMDRRVRTIIPDMDNGLPIHTLVENLILADETGKNLRNTICISCFTKLSKLVVGSSCFCKATGFECCHLPNLQSILIGEKSFTSWTRWTRPPSQPRDAHFMVEDCPVLFNLIIARYSFSDFASFTLREMPCLYLFTLGEKCTGARCFSHATLSLTGAFLFCRSSSDLPQLTRVTLGKGSFQFSQQNIIASRT